MTIKKFWCHYIGNDGNTPKRRSIELTDIHDLLSSVSNDGAKTPVWAERKEDNDGYRVRVRYNLYAQLNDSVAVATRPYGVINDDDYKIMQLSDADIEAEGKQRLERHLAAHPEYDEERKKREQEYFTVTWVDGSKKNRDRLLRMVCSIQDYDNLLLSGSSWVSTAILKAYEEAKSPILPGLKELRAIAMEEREAREKERKEQAKLRCEEEARKKAEAEARDQERLTQEAEKFRNGESIGGSDVVDLCRRYGINIHLRTVHNLQQVIANINGKTQTCQYYRQRGQRRPQLDGCYKTAVELYNYLQKHESH